MLGEFSKQIFPPIIVCLGIIGNIFTLIIFSRKNLSKISRLLRILTISDSFGILSVLQHYIKNNFGINIRILSDLSCKFFLYLAYIFFPISAWLLVYVCIERFFMIKFPLRYKFLQRKSVQIYIVSLIIILNSVLYSGIFVSVKVLKIMSNNQHNNSVTSLLCYPITLQLLNLFATIDIINSTIITSFLMVFNTGLLIYALYQSRAKFYNPNPTKQEKKRKKKDIQFALSCISLNILFLVMNVPNKLNTLINNDTSSDTFYILDDVFYLNFGLSFIIHFISNRNFRQEVFICISKMSNRSTRTN